jgi:glycosyltransferase involved in cell wall biosynthesis
MAPGLPVITTPRCGAVVSVGVDGFIVPPRDSEAFAKALHQYSADRTLLEGHGKAALEKSKQFTLNRLAANLLNLELELFSQSFLLLLSGFQLSVLYFLL